jgi:uncharacterized membrane protein
MSYDYPRVTAQIAGRPIRAMLAPFPVVFFVATLLTDLIYWKTAAGMWETFSIWLLTFGLIMAGFAILAELIDYFGNAQVRAVRLSLPHLIGNLAAALLSLWNAFVHSRDGYTAVVPEGLLISLVVVLILVVTGWLGLDMVYRYRVGVTPIDAPTRVGAE